MTPVINYVDLLILLTSVPYQTKHEPFAFKGQGLVCPGKSNGILLSKCKLCEQINTTVDKRNE